MTLSALDQPKHPMTLALEWVARGVPAFPCALYPGTNGAVDKFPIKGTRGHLDASLDPEVVRDMFVQAEGAVGRDGVLAVGLCPGPGGYVVLDPDVKAGQGGPDLADALGIPKGWLVITASGGEHRWFRKPDPDARYSNATPAEWHGRIDIRADNGWVVAPGTITPLGSWRGMEPWPADGPPVAPESVMKHLTPAGPDRGSTDSTYVGSLDDDTRALLDPKTEEVLDWLMADHGAHRPLVHQREDDGRHFVQVTRPRKSNGNSAHVGHAGPGALHLWSTNWRIALPDGSGDVPHSATSYPLGRGAPDLLGARLVPSRGVLTGTPVPSPATFFYRGQLQAADVAEAVMNMVPIAVDRNEDTLYAYRDGVWVCLPGEAAVRDACVRLLGNRYRASHKLTVADIVRGVAREIRPAQPDERYLNCANGMLDWRTGTLHPHSPAYLSTIQMPVVYDPDAKCPAFDDFIAQVVPEDVAGDFIDEFLGSIIYPSARFQKVFLMLGNGRNGKGTLLKVATWLVGEDNVSNQTLVSLTENRFATASLYGRLANIAGDLDSRRLSSTEALKMASGADTIEAERKGQPSFRFQPFATMVFAANKVFTTPDTSDGYFDRWIVVPFPRRFSDAEIDWGLEDRLNTPEELAGVLARAVRGLRSLHARGRFLEPPSVLEAKALFGRESDPVRAFLHECTEVAPGESVTQREVHELYNAWARAEGRGEMSSGALGQRIEQAGFTRGTTHKKKMIRGMRLTKVVGTGLSHGELEDVQRVSWQQAEAEIERQREGGGA